MLCFYTKSISGTCTCINKVSCSGCDQCLIFTLLFVSDRTHDICVVWLVNYISTARCKLIYFLEEKKLDHHGNKQLISRLKCFNDISLTCIYTSDCWVTFIPPINLREEGSQDSQKSYLSQPAVQFLPSSSFLHVWWVCVYLRGGHSTGRLECLVPLLVAYGCVYALES